MPSIAKSRKKRVVMVTTPKTLEPDRISEMFTGDHEEPAAQWEQFQPPYADDPRWKPDVQNDPTAMDAAVALAYKQVDVIAKAFGHKGHPDPEKLLLAEAVIKLTEMFKENPHD